MNIRIIGKGCYFCQQMTKIATEVAAELQAPDATVVQVDELNELLDYGVVNPPALVVNGKLKMMGRVLVRSHIQQAIAEEMAVAKDPAEGG
jgi:small redox-active disulfide protein 2